MGKIDMDKIRIEEEDNSLKIVDKETEEEFVPGGPYQGYIKKEKASQQETIEGTSQTTSWGHMYVGNYSKKIFEVNDDLSEKTSVKTLSDNATLYGITYDSQYFWALLGGEPEHKSVYKYDSNINKVGGPYSHPEIDSDNVWGVTSKNDKIALLNGPSCVIEVYNKDPWSHSQTINIDDKFNVYTTIPTGISFYNGYYYVGHLGEISKIYKFDDDGQFIEELFTLPENHDLRSICATPQNLYYTYKDMINNTFRLLKEDYTGSIEKSLKIGEFEDGSSHSFWVSEDGYENTVKSTEKTYSNAVDVPSDKVVDLEKIDFKADDNNTKLELVDQNGEVLYSSKGTTSEEPHKLIKPGRTLDAKISNDKVDEVTAGYDFELSYRNPDKFNVLEDTSIFHGWKKSISDGVYDLIIEGSGDDLYLGHEGDSSNDDPGEIVRFDLETKSELNSVEFSTNTEELSGVVYDEYGEYVFVFGYSYSTNEGMVHRFSKNLNTEDWVETIPETVYGGLPLTYDEDYLYVAYTNGSLDNEVAVVSKSDGSVLDTIVPENNGGLSSDISGLVVDGDYIYAYAVGYTKIDKSGESLTVVDSVSSSNPGDVMVKDDDVYYQVDTDLSNGTIITKWKSDELLAKRIFEDQMMISGQDSDYLYCKGENDFVCLNKSNLRMVWNCPETGSIMTSLVRDNDIIAVNMNSEIGKISKKGYMSREFKKGSSLRYDSDLDDFVLSGDQI